MALGVWGGGDVVGVVVGALGGVAGLEGGGLGGWVVAVRVGWGVVGLVGPCRFVAAG